MERKKRFGMVMGSLGLILLSTIFLAGRYDVFQKYGPLQKEFYLTQAQLLFIRPGLDLNILDVTIGEDRRILVTFSIKDPKGLPLDIDGVFTPGPVSVSFIISRIPAGESQYVSYITRDQTSPITGSTAAQPSTDRGGAFEKVEDGVYTYTFGTSLPADFDRDATHTLGVYARRDLTEFDLDRYVDNKVFHFVPSGAAPQPRDLVRSEACNQCHNPLALHGGSRREVGLCILCHTPQNSDPDTGNTVDFKVMIHKIHMGEHLPSVQAGTPYQIIGYRQSVHDFSEIAIPRDLRYCETCHVPGADQAAVADTGRASAMLIETDRGTVSALEGGTQSAAWMSRPSRSVCGSCHDDVNFATGENHMGGPQVSDNQCAFCHFPEGELEFDSSIKGAHTVPRTSRQLKGVNIQIREVVNTNPGQNPVVFFKITDNDGTPIAPSDLNFFNLNLSGPTTDYSTLVRESARQDSVPFEDGFTYTFQGRIPENAEGTFAVGAEAYRMVKLNAGTVKETDFRETEEENPVYYFAVTDAEATPRRTVVEEAKCNRCHAKLALHGTIRHDPQYCVTCHIPSGTDEERRPEAEFPPQSRHFKFLVHRIHRGHDLENDFTIYGFGGSAHNYNELHFPGDLRDCETCHVDDSYMLPLPEGLLPTMAFREYFSPPIQPVAAACLACHDGKDAAAHAFTMTSPFGEACAACHGRGLEFAVERVHAR